MIKFEKVEPGMRLADIHSERMGNTTMREKGLWCVSIVSVGPYGAQVEWNGNPASYWPRSRVERLYREDSPAVARYGREEAQRRARWRR